MKRVAIIKEIFNLVSYSLDSQSINIMVLHGSIQEERVLEKELSILYL